MSARHHLLPRSASSGWPQWSGSKTERVQAAERPAMLALMTSCTQIGEQPIFTSWNRIGQWLRHVDRLRQRPEPSAAARACAVGKRCGVTRESSRRVRRGSVSRERPMPCSRRRRSSPGDRPARWCWSCTPSAWRKTRSTARSTEMNCAETARLAVDGQREIAGRLVRDRPPALVDDVDVDRHQVERPT
jgi:hypothetical protein